MTGGVRRDRGQEVVTRATLREVAPQHLEAALDRVGLSERCEVICGGANNQLVSEDMDDALVTRVQSLMKRCGFRAKGFFVMDGSRRSAEAMVDLYADGTPNFDALRRLRDELGSTVVVVTHSPRVADGVDRVVELRDGRVV